jgi:hypothetical protein
MLPKTIRLDAKKVIMKKIVLAIFIIAAALISQKSFAQAGDHKTDLGIYIGPNFSNIDITSPELTTDMRSGWQTGLYFRSGKLIYAQAGFQYQLIRSNFSMPDTSGEISGDVTFRRLQLPLYGGINLLPITKGVLNIRAYAGPIISYDFNIPDNTLELQPSDFNRLRVDGTVGAGVDILIFSLDAGYSFGFSDLISQ